MVKLEAVVSDLCIDAGMSLHVQSLLFKETETGQSAAHTLLFMVLLSRESAGWTEALILMCIQA